MATKNTLVNKDFFEFVKAIGESKSKQEEDRIMTDEDCEEEYENV